ISYKNIPAELAWEMNLPLPDNYEFVYPLFGLSGGGALTSFFNKCSLNMNYDFHRDFGKSYVVNYNSFLKRKQNILYYTEYGLNVKNRNKFLLLLCQNNIVFLVRDPISRLKHAANHHSHNPNQNNDLNLTCNFDMLYSMKLYHTNVKGICSSSPTIESLQIWLNTNRWFLYLSFLESLKLKKLNITYIDMEEIKPEKAFDTMCVLANKFGFSKPTDEGFFKGIMNGDLFGFIPINFFANEKNLKCSDTTVYKNNSIHLQITSTNLIEFYGQSKEYINIISDFFDKPLKYDNLGIFIKPQDYEQLKQNNELLQATKNYLTNFIKALEERIEIEKSKLFKENDVLNYLKENKKLRVKLKKLLDKELVHLKQYRPDIVVSWKYYQEFEKMCKELDGN
ncbi:DUF2972 domain-containing protein, partial [Campylobacter peloridis]